MYIKFAYQCLNDLQDFLYSLAHQIKHLKYLLDLQIYIELQYIFNIGSIIRLHTKKLILISVFWEYTLTDNELRIHYLQFTNEFFYDLKHLLDR